MIQYITEIYTHSLFNLHNLITQLTASSLFNTTQYFDHNLGLCLTVHYLRYLHTQYFILISTILQCKVLHYYRGVEYRFEQFKAHDNYNVTLTDMCTFKQRFVVISLTVSRVAVAVNIITFESIKNDRIDTILL